MHSTLQYSMLQCRRACYIALQYITVQHSMLQCSTVCYSALQYVTVQYSMLHCITVRYGAVHSVHTAEEFLTCPASSFVPALCLSFTSSTAFSFFLTALALFSFSSPVRDERSTLTGIAAATAAAAAAAANDADMRVKRW
jgi:hypothetical protein